jgi:hypothetical protein
MKVGGKIYSKETNLSLDLALQAICKSHSQYAFAVT